MQYLPYPCSLLTWSNRRSFASLPQKDTRTGEERTYEQKMSFSKALLVMMNLYASVRGTCVLQQKRVRSICFKL